MHTVLPSPSAQTRAWYLRKRSRSPWVRKSLGSQHHQLCHHHNLQLIQTRLAPSHGPPARVLSHLSFPARSLLLPEPYGKMEHPKAAQSQLLTKPPGLKTSMAATPGFKSQSLSSSAPPFPTPPTISYICQHSRIFPTFLGCHS